MLACWCVSQTALCSRANLTIEYISICNYTSEWRHREQQSLARTPRAPVLVDDRVDVRNVVCLDCLGIFIALGATRLLFVAESDNADVRFRSGRYAKQTNERPIDRSNRCHRTLEGYVFAEDARAVSSRSSAARKFFPHALFVLGSHRAKRGGGGKLEGMFPRVFFLVFFCFSLRNCGRPLSLFSLPLFLSQTKTRDGETSSVIIIKNDTTCDNLFKVLKKRKEKVSPFPPNRFDSLLRRRFCSPQASERRSTRFVIR